MQNFETAKNYAPIEGQIREEKKMLVAILGHKYATVVDQKMCMLNNVMFCKLIL